MSVAYLLCTKTIFSCHLCDHSAFLWRYACWAGVRRFIFTYPAEYQSRLKELRAGPLQTGAYPSSNAWRPYASLWYKTHRLTVKNTGLEICSLPILLIYHLSLYRLWHNLWWYKQWPVSFWRLHVVEWTLTFNTDWPIVFNARFLFCLLSVIQTAQERFMGWECKCTMYASVSILLMHVLGWWLATMEMYCDENVLCVICIYCFMCVIWTELQ